MGRLLFLAGGYSCSWMVTNDPGVTLPPHRGRVSGTQGQRWWVLLLLGTAGPPTPAKPNVVPTQVPKLTVTIMKHSQQCHNMSPAIHALRDTPFCRLNAAIFADSHAGWRLFIANCVCGVPREFREGLWCVPVFNIPADQKSIGNAGPRGLTLCVASMKTYINHVKG